MKFPDGFLIGMEIEFCIPNERYASFITKSRPMRDLTNWERDEEGGLAPREPARQIEMRLSRPVNFFCISELAGLLRCIKAHDGFTTRRCGLHIHVSHPDSGVIEHLRVRLVDVLWCIKPFPERACYCLWTTNEVQRYRAINVISPNRFEVRLFNGTLKLRGILHALGLIHKEALRLQAGHKP